MEAGLRTPGGRSLQREPEFDISDGKIELGALIAGISGWGVASASGKGGQTRLDADGFRKLERDVKLRKFIRWQEGRFFKAGEDSGYAIGRKKLH